MTTVYQTTDAPVSQRIAAWERAIEASLPPLIGRHDDAFEARMVSGQLGAVTVTEATTPAGVCARTPRLIRPADHGLYQLDVVGAGHVVVDHAGRQSRLGPADFTLVDPAQPIRYRATDSTHTSVLFPRTMLPLRHDEVLRLTGQRLSGERGSGALVSSLARQLPRYLDDWHTGEAVSVGTSMVDLLRAALTTWLHRDRPPGQDIVERIYAFIDANLGDPDLCPAAIAEAHHISLRHLYKLFESQPDSVAGWIRQRRLERCRRDLLDPIQRQRPVSAIAAEWGLPNAAHFNRIFKAVYGVPPAEYRSSL